MNYTGGFMICYVCDKENWHELKEHTDWDRTMAVCKNCGNLVYLVDKDHEQKIKDYYDKEYRGTIGPDNLLTTTRKLNYIKLFLAPFLKDNKNLVVGDVGCATGYLVDWFRRNGHKATGTEWTTKMRRFAEHFYGIPVTEELQSQWKYDLICMYHTLEHMTEPDKKLSKYRDMIKDDGHLFVSVPEWLNILEEPGIFSVRDFANIYHKDHIDIFTYNSFSNLLKKAGLQVVSEDRYSYGGQTYLLRKTRPSNNIVKDDWQKVKDAVQKTKDAIKHFQKEQYREALNLWPKFPYCYLHWIYYSTTDPVKKDLNRAGDLWKEALEIMPDNITINAAYGNWLYQQNKFDEAMTYYQKFSSKRVNEDTLIYMGHCCLNLKMYKEAMQFYMDASQINPMKWTEMMKFVCNAATSLPTWDERAKQELKDKLFSEAQVKIIPQDPLFKDLQPAEKEIKPHGEKEKKEAEKEKEEKVKKG